MAFAAFSGSAIGRAYSCAAPQARESLLRRAELIIRAGVLFPTSVRLKYVTEATQPYRGALYQIPRYKERVWRHRMLLGEATGEGSVLQ